MFVKANLKLKRTPGPQTKLFEHFYYRYINYIYYCCKLKKTVFSSNFNYGNNNVKHIKTLNIKDISCNNRLNINDNENIHINSTNNSVDYNNQRITRSIAKMIKENLEQVSDNCAKSISKIHNNITINKY